MDVPPPPPGSPPGTSSPPPRPPHRQWTPGKIALLVLGIILGLALLVFGICVAILTSMGL
jgi:hypothetical protein